MTGRLAWVQMRNWKPWAGWETNLTVDFARPRGHVSQKGKQNRHKNRSKSKVSNNVKLLGQKVPLKKIINKNGQGEILLQKAKSYSPNSYQAKITRKGQKGQKADFNERVYQKNHFINQTFARLRKRNKKPSKKPLKGCLQNSILKTPSKASFTMLHSSKHLKKQKSSFPKFTPSPEKKATPSNVLDVEWTPAKIPFCVFLPWQNAPVRPELQTLRSGILVPPLQSRQWRKKAFKKRKQEERRVTGKVQRAAPRQGSTWKQKKNTLHRHRTGAKHLAPQPMVSTSPLQAQTMKTLWPPIARRFLWCNLLRVSEVKARTVFCGDKKRSGKTCKVAG